MTEQNEAIDYLSNIPIEMLLHILQYLSDHENKSVIPLLSKHFHAVSSEYFIDHIYDRSLKFRKWQKTFIENLEKNTLTFKNKFQVSLLNMPDQSRGLAILEQADLFVSLTFLAIVIYGGYRYYIQNDNSYVIQSREHTYKLLLFLFFAIKHIATTLLNLPVRNNLYLARTITQEHIDALNVLYQTNSLFGSMPDVQINGTTISQMLKLVDQSLAETKNTADLLIKYFDGKRFSPIKTLTTGDMENLNKISPNLKNYSMIALSLWSASTNNLSIIPETLTDKIKLD